MRERRDGYVAGAGKCSIGNSRLRPNPIRTLLLQPMREYIELLSA